MYLAEVYFEDELLLEWPLESSSQFEVVTVVPHLLAWTVHKIAIETVVENEHYRLFGDYIVDVFVDEDID